MAGVLMFVLLSQGLTPDAGVLTRPLVAVGYYVDSRSWTTVETQGHRLNWIITTNYGLVNPAGELRGMHDPELARLAVERGLQVHVRVANFVNGSWSRDIAHAVLTQPAIRTNAIDGILSILDWYGYDGVNIDFENVPPADRGPLTAFMTALYTAVRARGKVLSITIPGKTADQLDNDWNGAFDLAALGRVSDWVIVMAYDEHWSTSAPGPVASLSWVDAVVRFTVGQVRPQKVLLGVPFYGYDWPHGGPAKAVSMREAVDRAADTGAEIQWDEQAQVPYYRARGRTVYFEDARSIERKFALAASQGLAGVAAWRLGLELPETWDVVSSYLKTPPVAASVRE